MARNENDIKNLAWNSFSKTGKIGYYLLFRAVSEYGGKIGTDNNGDCDPKNPIP